MVQFRPDNTITRAEVAKILTVLDGDFDVNKTYANKFSDVHDGTWYQIYQFRSRKNYISGDENGMPSGRYDFKSRICVYNHKDILILNRWTAKINLPILQDLIGAKSI